jgi:hypothetical protein
MIKGSVSSSVARSQITFTATAYKIHGHLSIFHGHKSVHYGYIHGHLKGQRHEIFDLWFFIIPGPLIHGPF